MRRYSSFFLMFMGLFPVQISHADGEYLGKNPGTLLFTSLAVIGVPFLSGLTPNIYKKDETYSYWASTGMGVLGLVGGIVLGSSVGTETKRQDIYDVHGSYQESRTVTEINYLPSFFLGGLGMLAGNYVGYLNSKKPIVQMSGFDVVPTHNGLFITISTVF